MKELFETKPILFTQEEIDAIDTLWGEYPERKGHVIFSVRKKVLESIKDHIR